MQSHSLQKAESSGPQASVVHGIKYENSQQHVPLHMQIPIPGPVVPSPSANLAPGVPMTARGVPLAALGMAPVQMPMFRPPAKAPPPEVFAHLKLRSGKWIPEEEQYADLLIELFEKGMIMECDNGATLRSFLSRKLHCAPMRVSKKYAGKGIGKKVFLTKMNVENLQGIDMSEVPRAEARLKEAEARFHAAVFAEQPNSQQPITIVPPPYSGIADQQNMFPGLVPLFPAPTMQFASTIMPMPAMTNRPIPAPSTVTPMAVTGPTTAVPPMIQQAQPQPHVASKPPTMLPAPTVKTVPLNGSSTTSEEPQTTTDDSASQLQESYLKALQEIESMNQPTKEEQAPMDIMETDGQEIQQDMSIKPEWQSYESKTQNTNSMGQPLAPVGTMSAVATETQEQERSLKSVNVVSGSSQQALMQPTIDQSYEQFQSLGNELNSFLAETNENPIPVPGSIAAHADMSMQSLETSQNVIPSMLPHSNNYAFSDTVGPIGTGSEVQEKPPMPICGMAPETMTAESYMMFAQQSVVAVSQHSAYLRRGTYANPDFHMYSESPLLIPVDLDVALSMPSESSKEDKNEWGESSSNEHVNNALTSHNLNVSSDVPFTAGGIPFTGETADEANVVSGSEPGSSEMGSSRGSSTDTAASDETSGEETGAATGNSESDDSNSEQSTRKKPRVTNLGEQTKLKHQARE